MKPGDMHALPIPVRARHELRIDTRAQGHAFAALVAGFSASLRPVDGLETFRL